MFLVKLVSMFLLSHSNVARTSANHYTAGAYEITTNACTVTPTGLSAGIERDSRGRAWITWRDAHGEIESDPCQILSVARR